MFNLLQDYSLLQLVGADASKFLQGQLTCDVTELSDTHTSLAAHCNPQGRMLSLFRLLKHHDYFYLVLPTDLVTITQQALDKYLVFSKANLSQVLDWQQVGLMTTDPSLLVSLLGNVPQQLHACYQTTDSILTYVAKLGQHHYYQLLTKTTTSLSLAEGVHSLTDTAWHLMQIKAGIPWLAPATSAKFLPHDINLPQLGGVSFTKGCYTGQEIITRMQHRGTIKTHCYAYSVTTNIKPKANEPIYNSEQQIIGRIICGAAEPGQHYSLLAAVKDKYAKQTSNYLLQGDQTITLIPSDS